jgi:hypothetical protein
MVSRYSGKRGHLEDPYLSSWTEQVAGLPVQEPSVFTRRLLFSRRIARDGDASRQHIPSADLRGKLRCVSSPRISSPMTYQGS